MAAFLFLIVDVDLGLKTLDPGLPPLEPTHDLVSSPHGS